MFQHTSGTLLTKYSSHVKRLEESLYHLHIHCREELKTSYGDYYLCLVVMYMYKMDSTISNICTYTYNEKVLLKVFRILPFSVLLLSTTCPVVKGLPHTYTFMLYVPQTSTDVYWE